jgi:hypothetical protein
MMTGNVGVCAWCRPDLIAYPVGGKYPDGTLVHGGASKGKAKDKGEPTPSREYEDVGALL